MFRNAIAQPNVRVKLRGHDGAIHQRNVGIAMTLLAIVVVPSAPVHHARDRDTGETPIKQGGGGYSSNAN
jgi:hypothetical protein